MFRPVHKLQQMSELSVVPLVLSFALLFLFPPPIVGDECGKVVQDGRPPPRMCLEILLLQSGSATRTVENRRDRAILEIKGYVKLWAAASGLPGAARITVLTRRGSAPTNQHAKSMK